jgi:hypothetical protein
MHWIVILSLFTLYSCSHQKRTAYKPLHKGEGFADSSLEDSLKMATFKANSKTKPGQASMFARFRAIEICKSQSDLLTHIMQISDKTQTEKIMRISSTGYPAYYFGMSPYYHRYSGFGFGFSTMSSQTWSETLTYPNFEIIYRCTKKIMEPKLELVEIPSPELRHLVKDLSGAILIQKILPDSPNQKLIRSGDILMKVEGNRIQKIYELLNAFYLKKELKVDLLRDGELKKSVNLIGTDVTDSIKNEEQNLLQKACTYDDLKNRIPCRK